MAFDPRPHLIKVQGGKEYLEVKWRLVWLKDAHSNASVETELVSFSGDVAVMRAVVTIPTEDGHARYTGYKTAPMSGKFPAIEKAETGAVGRALAHAGFGTQFAGEDVEEGLDDGQMADSPVQRQAPRPAQASRPAPPPSVDLDDVPFDVPFDGPQVELATEKQVKLMGVLMDKAAISVEDARAVLKEKYGKVSRLNLTKSEASNFIDWLQEQVPHEQPALVN